MAIMNVHHHLLEDHGIAELVGSAQNCEGTPIAPSFIGLPPLALHYRLIFRMTDIAARISGSSDETTDRRKKSARRPRSSATGARSLGIAPQADQSQRASHLINHMEAMPSFSCLRIKASDTPGQIPNHLLRQSQSGTSE
jgi:hypothetical protein